MRSGGLCGVCGRKTPYHKEMTKTYQMSVLLKEMQILSKYEIDNSPNVVEKLYIPQSCFKKCLRPVISWALEEVSAR